MDDEDVSIDDYFIDGMLFILGVGAFLLVGMLLSLVLPFESNLRGIVLSVITLVGGLVGAFVVISTVGFIVVHAYNAVSRWWE